MGLRHVESIIVRIIVAVALMLVALARCAVEPEPPKVDPDLLLLRPVTTTPTPGAASAAVEGQTVYFDPSQRIIDASHLQLKGTEVEVIPNETGTAYALSLETTAEGGELLHDWTSRHLQQQLGVFLDGRLLSAPFVMSPIRDMILLQGQFTRDEAEALAKRLRRGGAP